MRFNTIDQAIQDIREGKMVIVVDDEDRENEGDLVMAAQKVTPESINFMAKYARGLICVPMTARKVEELELPQMVEQNSDIHGTAFTVSVDAACVTTGISAHERARTINVLTDSSTTPGQLRRPGHVFPLKAREGGVLKRAGHTEAAVDLARIAGLQSIGVICEIMKDDGTMARLPELFEFSREHHLSIITIEDLIEYRMQVDKMIKRVAVTRMPTIHGNFTAYAYQNIINGKHHVALVKGDVSTGEPVLARVHSECLTGDAFGSLRCDCAEQLARALEMVEEEGRGVVLYMRQEGRGIGLLNKLRAYELQDKGYDTVEANIQLGFPADLRDYGIGAQILRDLGIKKMRLMTNNPRKVTGISGYGLEVVERVPLEIPANKVNRKYLETKKAKLGHYLHT